ncbi:MAG: AprI/Inh family metalloprotease inhibitor [Xanthobacteraceae bacterium]
MAALAVLVSLAGCTSVALFDHPEPKPAPSASYSAPSPPPPVDMSGNWQLAAAAGGSCIMTFGKGANVVSAGTVPQGSIAPEGGCPGSFFTSRQWAFDDGTLIIRDFKGRSLAHLSYVGGHFEGKDKNGGALTLSRQL